MIIAILSITLWQEFVVTVAFEVSVYNKAIFYDCVEMSAHCLLNLLHVFLPL